MATCIPCQIIIIDAGKVAGKLQTAMSLLSSRETAPDGHEEICAKIKELDNMLEEFIDKLTGEDS